MSGKFKFGEGKAKKGGNPFGKKESPFGGSDKGKASVFGKKKPRPFAEGGHVERLGTDQTFGQAFREARKEGAKTFRWRGKNYTTDMAKSKPLLTPKRDIHETEPPARSDPPPFDMKTLKAGNFADEIPAFKSGGRVGAKKRDGCAVRGKTKGRFC